MEIGAQLFTVRDFCKDISSLSETLKKVADIGYKNVQVSGVCAYEPEWLKEQLDKNGLKCVLTHVPLERLRDEAEKVSREHDVLDCKYIGLGYYGFGNEKGNCYEDFVKDLKPAARALKENGKYFMFHNHDNEFKHINGKVIYGMLADEFAPDEMGFTLDTYWVQVGGGDPAYWLERLSGRVPCIHLKDCAYGRKMAVLGEGNINFDRVFEKAESSGTRYMLVEQDDCSGEDPFNCLKRSYDYLRSRGF